MHTYHIQNNVMGLILYLFRFISKTDGGLKYRRMNDSIYNETINKFNFKLKSKDWFSLSRGMLHKNIKFDRKVFKKRYIDAVARKDF